MDADLDLLLIIVFVTADDLVPEDQTGLAFPALCAGLVIVVGAVNAKLLPRFG